MIDQSPEDLEFNLVSLVPRFTLFCKVRAAQIRQGKAQAEGDGPSLAKDCNAALAHLDGSLRARRQAAICVVALTCIS